MCEGKGFGCFPEVEDEEMQQKSAKPTEFGSEEAVLPEWRPEQQWNRCFAK